MKKIYLELIYYPIDSYLDYKLKCFIDGIDICEFYYENKKVDNKGFIFPLYNWFKENLEFILNESSFEENSLSKECGIEMIEKANKKKFQNEEELELWIDKISGWESRHSWTTSGPLLFLPEVIFRKKDKKIEISWDNSKREQDYNITFTSLKGVAFIDVEEFKEEIEKFTLKVEEIELIKNKKLKKYFDLKENRYVKYDENDVRKISFETEILNELKDIGYNVKNIHQLILLKEADKKVVPILLKYLLLISREQEKECLVRFLAVKNFTEAFPLLIKEFYEAKTRDYKLALSNTLSIIYDKRFLETLLKIVSNKDYGEVRIPIILGLYQYSDNKVLETLEKLLDDTQIEKQVLKIMDMWIERNQKN